MENVISGRAVLNGVALAAVVVLMGGCAMSQQKATQKGRIDFDNSYFYDADGKFKPEAAKDAYIAMMEYHGYPVFANVREKLWVSDYGTGQFARLGLGVNMVVNNEKDRYMLMDIFLLPGQMLPEHYHLPTDKNPSKMEGWMVRHGVSYVYGEGEPTPNMKAVVPRCHMNGSVTVKHEVILVPGRFTSLNRVGARHWQFGGPEGAIVTEVANVHDDGGVRHSDTNLVFP